MATIITQPTPSVVCINEPVNYEFQEVLTGPDATPSAIEMQFEIDSVLKDVSYLDAFTVVRSTDTTCTFKCNVNEVLQKFNVVQDIIAAFESPTLLTVQNAVGYRLKLTAWLPNISGVLEKDGTSIFSTKKYLSNSVLKEHETTSDLSGYFTANSNRPFLTTAKIVSITKTDFANIAYYKPLSELIILTVRFYNASGLLKTATIQVPASNNSTPQYIIVNVNYDVIMNATYDLVAGSGEMSDATYYTVQLTDSELITVNIVEACRGYRVHFLNRFGFFDSVTLLSDKVDTLKVKSDIFERVKSIYTNHSVSILSRQGQKAYEGYANNLSPNEATWLEELLMTPKAYLEENGKLLPIVVEDATNDLKVTGELTAYKVNMYLSNKRFSQRN